MSLYYLSLILVIISNVFYHIFQKSTPDKINPFLSLIISYLVALLFTIMLYLCQPQKDPIATSMKTLNWASFGLGFAIVGLEIGFLLAYRAGWNMSLAVTTTNILITLILIPLGILLFNEKFSIANILGILLCIGGLILLKK